MEEWFDMRVDPAQIARKLIDSVGGVQPAHLFLPMYTVTEMIRRSGRS